MEKKRGTSTSPNREPDERVRRSKETVLATTYQMMSETGLGGVSIDAVSKRSGVAKTTIYRHWPSRAELLLEACSKLSSKPPVPDTGSFRGDIMALAAGIANRLRTANFATILPSVIDAAERDPQLARLHAQLHAGFMAPLYAVIERAQKKGEIGRDLQASYFVARIVGPLFYRRWFSREPLDESFVQTVVKGALSATGSGDPS